MITVTKTTITRISTEATPPDDIASQTSADLALETGGSLSAGIIYSPCCKSLIKAKCQSCGKGCLRCNKGIFLLL